MDIREQRRSPSTAEAGELGDPRTERTPTPAQRELERETGSRQSQVPQEESAQKMKQEMSELGRELKDHAIAFVQQLRQQAEDAIRDRKSGMVEQTHALGDAFHGAAGKLRERQRHGLADAASRAGDQLEKFGEFLAQRDVRDIADQAASYVRRHRTAVFLGAIVAGVGLARLAKVGMSQRSERFWTGSEGSEPSQRQERYQPPRRAESSERVTSQSPSSAVPAVTAAPLSTTTTTAPGAPAPERIQEEL